MKRERTSYAFLMEMIWVCAFFLLCSSLFVMAFAKAEQISRRANVLNEAVQSVSNVMEELLASSDADDPSSILNAYATDDFSITLEQQADDGLTLFLVSAVNPDDGTIIYSLRGAKAPLASQMKGGTS